MYVFVNIGSNDGDKRLNLSRAVRMISERFGNFEVSHSVESKPWGYDSSKRYLNIGMAFQSDLSPIETLHELQKIEKTICPEPHRNTDGTYRDRIIDIDIMAIDTMQIDEPGLTVPHPHLHERSFFLEPMVELAPLWRHPANGLTASEMLSSLN